MRVLVLHPDENVHKSFDKVEVVRTFSSKTFDEHVSELRKPFSSLIDSILKNYSDIDFAVTALGSRNTITSQAFLRICYVHYALTEIRAGRVDAIIVDSEAVRSVLANEAADSNIRVDVFENKKISRLVKRFVKFGYFFFDLFLRWFWTKCLSNFTPRESDSLRIFDIFVDENSIAKGNFTNRYYADFVESDLSFLWTYVPTFYRVKNRFKVITVLRKNDVPFLFKEKWLHLLDFIWIALHPYRLRSIKIVDAHLFECDVSPILKLDLLEQSMNSASLEALVNYVFFKNLSLAKVKLELSLDWYEGQEIDRGFQCGLSQFFPNCIRVGYQGFIVTQNYLCQKITPVEKAIGSAPQFLAVMGSALVNSSREFDSALQTYVAPAFRFGLSTAAREFSPREKPIIFVPFPIMVKESRQLIDVVWRLVKFYGEKVTILIKLHPANDMSDEIDVLLKNGSISSTTEPLEKFSSCISLIVSSTSSIVVEALVQGIPAVVIASPTELSHNPIPLQTFEGMWTMCYEFGQIGEISSRYLSFRDLSDIEVPAAKSMFEPHSIDSSLSFRHFLLRLCRLQKSRN